MASCSPVFHVVDGGLGLGLGLGRRGFQTLAAEVALLFLLGVLVATGKGQAVTAFTVGLGDASLALMELKTQADWIME